VRDVDEKDRMHPSIELTTEEWHLLERLTATVLPSDEQPGACEADVIGFLRRAFGAGRWAGQRELLTTGLRTLDALARSQCGSAFASCPPDACAAVLDRLQRVPHRSARRFLTLAIDMTLAGFLCAPRHGGNRDRIGWTVVGWQPIEPSRTG
jgi:gluconate 2-dehydrogenase gamma chain